MSVIVAAPHSTTMGRSWDGTILSRRSGLEKDCKNATISDWRFLTCASHSHFLWSELNVRFRKSVQPSCSTAAPSRGADNQIASEKSRCTIAMLKQFSTKNVPRYSQRRQPRNTTQKAPNLYQPLVFTVDFGPSAPSIRSDFVRFI